MGRPAYWNALLRGITWPALGDAHRGRFCGASSLGEHWWSPAATNPPERQGSVFSRQRDETSGRRLERRDDDLALPEREALDGRRRHLRCQGADADARAVPEGGDRGDRRPQVVQGGVA